MPRRTPYTQIGIRRLTCARRGCRNRASQQWQICADRNVYRPICGECDVALNRLVIDFMGWAGRERALRAYARRMQDPHLDMSGWDG